MLYAPKDYRTNRKAVLMLRKKLASETITTAKAIAMGAKKAQLAKWMKEGKLQRILWNGQNRYRADKVKILIIESFK